MTAPEAGQIALDASAPRVATAVRLEPDAEAIARLTAALDLLALRKVRLEGTLRPVGRLDWDFDGQLGATVVQACVATLAPVTTRLDGPVERRFRADLTPPEAGSEYEMPEDVAEESLPAALDLEAVLAEELALALPDYPRADGAEEVRHVTAAPGVTPLTDEAMRPFAGLAGLRAPPKDDD